MPNVFIHATDTCYGFATPWNNIQGIKYIQGIKQRDKGKPFSLLFQNISQVKEFCYVSEKQEVFIKDILEKNTPASFILEKKEVLKNYFPNFSSVSCRIENDNFLVKMASLLACPVTSTSVNTSGEKPLYSPQEIQEKFPIDTVISASEFNKENIYNSLCFINSGDIQKNEPSAIWDLTKDLFIQIR